MGAETFSVFCLFLLALTGLGTSQLTITPDQPIMIKPPPSTPPNTIALMECIIETSNMSEVETRWILPDGEIIPDSPDGGQFRVDLGLIVLPNNDTIVTSLLLIQMLSYQDAGSYECEVRSTSLPENPSSWISASVELQLRVSLQAGANVTVNDTESEVELSCEMTLYIREDEDLQWFRSGLLIENSGRHTVTYRNGTPNAAQRGGDATIPGRVAVLTISDLVEEDSDTYTCEIAGTTESQDVQLSVLSARVKPSTPTTVQPTVTPTQTDANSESQLLLPLVIVLGVLLGIAIIVIVLVIFVFLWKRMKTHGKTSQPSNQEPIELSQTSPQFLPPTRALIDNQLPNGSDIDEDTYYANNGLGPKDTHGDTDTIYYSYPAPIVQVKVERNAAYGITSELPQRNLEVQENIAYGQLRCPNAEERES